MNDILPFIVSGIAAGSIYGLAGAGLVLTYKTSGIFNFGYGAMGTVAAYIFYFLHVAHNVGWGIAAVVSVLIAGPVMGLVMEPLARRLTNQPMLYKIVGTVGIVVLVQGLGVIAYGPDTTPVSQFLPKANQTFTVAGVNITHSQLTITVVAVLATVALFSVFRFTRIGTAMRAVVDDSDLLDLQGTDPIKVRRIAWIAGSTMAALSGVLVLPILGLDATLLTFLIVQAFGAAAIGAFSSIPLTFLGGLLLGIASNVTSNYVVSVPWLSGLPGGIPFICLFVVLLLLPKRKLLPPASIVRRSPPPYHGPRSLRLAAAAISLALLLVIPLFVGATNMPFYTTALTLMIVILSLGLLVKTSGQVSLCHAAFMAIGACAFSSLEVNAGIPWLFALVLAALIVVPVGAFIAIPAIRLSGLFLALATFGFGILVEQFFYPLSFMFGTANIGKLVPRPSFAQSDTAWYYFVLLLVVIASVAMIAIHSGRLGRILRGMSDSPLATSTMGLSTNVTRVIVFCISAFMAAIGGILYSATFSYATSGDPTFGSFYSLVLLAMLAIAPFREPWYVLPAAIGAVIPAYWTSSNSVDWLNALFGVFAISVAVSGGPPVMSPRLRAVADRLGHWGKTQAEALPPPDGDSPLAADLTASALAEQWATADVEPSGPARHHRQLTGLQMEGLTVRFGGIVAVDKLTLSAPTGRITGLIGPNGAGKSTTFNACSGLNSPSSGRVLLHGENVSHRPAAARARLGLGRTFQHMQLCDTLSVVDNVILGRESSQAGNRVLSQLMARPAEFRQARRAAADAMRLCGITDLADRQAGDLSTGQRRLVELARCLAGPFDLLLLDEPSSGLGAAESQHFGELLVEVVRRRGCGVLLVEHDVGLVMRICSYIYVLDSGELLFEGNPRQVAASSAVQAAYLGETEPMANAQSGDPAEELR